MAAFFPEGNTVLAQDTEWRLLLKWADLLYAAVGNVPCQFPEGTQPLPRDKEHRLIQKINKMNGG